MNIPKSLVYPCYVVMLSMYKANKGVVVVVVALCIKVILTAMGIERHCSDIF